MVKVEARLVAAAAGAPPIWVQTLERDAKATLARVAGIDDGEGGLTTWGLAVAGVPELESRNLSSRAADKTIMAKDTSHYVCQACGAQIGRAHV